MTRKWKAAPKALSGSCINKISGYKSSPSGPGDRLISSRWNCSLSRSTIARPPLYFPEGGRHFAPTKKRARIFLILVRSTSPMTTWSMLGGITPTFRPPPALRPGVRSILSARSSHLREAPQTCRTAPARSGRPGRIPLPGASSPSAWNFCSIAASCSWSRSPAIYP